MAKRIWEKADNTNKELRDLADNEPEAEADRVAPAKVAHVHDWTVYPSGKRKCKPCGAVERS